MLEKYKQHPTLLKYKSDNPLLNNLVLIVAIIMIWRGVWGLLDSFLFPGWPIFSYLVSVALGALILYLDDFSLDHLKK